MLLDNFCGDRKSRPCRGAWWSRTAERGARGSRRKAVAGIADRDFDGGAIFAEGTVQAEDAEKAALHASAALSMRLARARRMDSGSASTWQAGLEIPLHGDAFKAAGKEREGFSITLFMSQARGWARKLREGGELIDEGTQVPTQPRMTSLHLRMTLQ